MALMRLLGMAIVLALAPGANAAPARSKAKPVLKRSLPGAPVVPTQPADKMPLKISMSFSEVRAATPEVTWTMTPVERYATRGFARLLSARGAAALDGLSLDVIASRGPTADRFTQHFVSASLPMAQGACADRIERFATALAKHVGKPEGLDAWVNNPTMGMPEPWSVNLADKLIYGVQINGDAFTYTPNLSTRFDRAFLNATGWPVQPEYKKLATAHEYPKGIPVLAWWHIMTQGSVNYTVIGIFERPISPSMQNSVSFKDSPDTPGSCRMGFSAVADSGQSNAANDLIAPQYKNYFRRDLKSTERLADRYHALQLRADQGLKGAEADNYLCRVAPASNRLIECRGETPEPPKARKAKGAPIAYTTRTAPAFLSSFAVPGPPWDEDDFAPRWARVEFAFESGDVAPIFDWDKGFAERRLGDGTSRSVSLNKSLNITGDDYPPIATRDNISADVQVDCVVLDDLSVFCGRVKATIISGTMTGGSPRTAENLFEQEVQRLISRRMQGTTALAKTKDGNDARGLYFRMAIKFRQIS
jgi:hypothetical protein